VKRAAKMGRPPLGDAAKAVVFTLRITEADRAAFSVAAHRTGKHVTEWARDVLIREALSSSSS
jgi:hypothetical protein